MKYYSAKLRQEIAIIKNNLCCIPGLSPIEEFLMRVFAAVLQQELTQREAIGKLLMY